MWNSKNSNRLKSQIGLEFWGTWIIIVIIIVVVVVVVISFGLWKVLEKRLKLQPQNVGYYELKQHKP
jgi:uncharacterized membrane protein